MKKTASKKTTKKQPFVKHPHSTSVAPVVIALLLAFNFAYAYAIGIPLAHIVVHSYVESVYALGDIQEQTYMMMGSAVVATVNAAGNVHAGFNTTNITANTAAVASVSSPHHPKHPPPLLLIAPNQIRNAK